MVWSLAFLVLMAVPLAQGFTLPNHPSQHQCISETTSQPHGPPTPVSQRSSTTAAFAINPKNKSNKDDGNDDKPTIWKTFQEKPGGLILLPFVAIFGLDLLLNIFFLTKRSIEFFVLGQTPSQETWY